MPVLTNQNIVRIDFFRKLYQKYFKNIAKYASLLISKIPFFIPSSNIYLIWSIIQTINIFFLIFIISVSNAFQMKISNIIPTQFYTVCVFLVFFEILVYLNTAQYQMGIKETSRMNIFKTYLKERLVHDIIAIFIFGAFNPNAIS